ARSRARARRLPFAARPHREPHAAGRRGGGAAPRGGCVPRRWTGGGERAPRDRRQAARALALAALLPLDAISRTARRIRRAGGGARRVVRAADASLGAAA